jgi:hypothetical protein
VRVYSKEELSDEFGIELPTRRLTTPILLLFVVAVRGSRVLLFRYLVCQSPKEDSLYQVVPINDLKPTTSFKYFKSNLLSHIQN